ncbi:hypothetical protein QBC38DRAFT_460068 [Podospora fimiseda]|uniref:PNPLA domain-containing protein n=1 Tax=Podospora fimiseda TaxID=252190 RepID=A0AAN6YTW0_9PEZI|nr:hypothetical protein QBC38DRAFT_460068 [Podospora fimiseda]
MAKVVSVVADVTTKASKVKTLIEDLNESLQKGKNKSSQAVTVNSITQLSLKFDVWKISNMDSSKVPDVSEWTSKLLDDLIEGLENLQNVLREDLPVDLTVKRASGGDTGETPAEMLLQTAFICCDGLLKGLSLDPDVKVTSRPWFQRALQLTGGVYGFYEADTIHTINQCPKLGYTELLQRYTCGISLRGQYLRSICDQKVGNSLLGLRSGSAGEQVQVRAPVSQKKQIGCLKKDCVDCVNCDSEQEILALPLSFPSLGTLNDTESGYFRCPFCDKTQRIECETTWRAYFRTYESPKYEFQFFNNSHAWMEHELQTHRFQWSCPFFNYNNSAPFISPKEFRQHIESGKHPEVDAKTQKIEIIEAANRHPAQTIAARESPFCYDWEYQIYTHVARHMVDLDISALSIKTVGEDSCEKLDEKPVQTKERIETAEKPSSKKTDSAGLCVLSIDDGGSGSLSTLVVIRGIMKLVNEQRLERGLPEVKPWEIFDTITEVGTGGLIAIMLGRLEMAIEGCAFGLGLEAPSTRSVRQRLWSLVFKPERSQTKIESMIAHWKWSRRDRRVQIP